MYICIYFKSFLSKDIYELYFVWLQEYVGSVQLPVAFAERIWHRNTIRLHKCETECIIRSLITQYQLEDYIWNALAKQYAWNYLAVSSICMEDMILEIR